jgi:hypothetical protein
MDSFSRFSELFPLKTGDAESVAECLFAVYNRYGRPRIMRADGAKAFHGSVLKVLNRMLGVENHITLAYSPYQNGQNERQNQEICRHLRAMVLGDILGVNSMIRWGILTSAAQRILNNTVHGDLMCTPNELLLGGYGDSDMAMFQADPAVGEGEAATGSCSLGRTAPATPYELKSSKQLYLKGSTIEGSSVKCMASSSSLPPPPPSFPSSRPS